ncbi:hypothetical protein PHISP_00223 [Aspergillus sp. HF37]|nr:hypothetical protein PHISP_00223 [Aspergillus sp. HF37]
MWIFSRLTKRECESDSKEHECEVFKEPRKRKNENNIETPNEREYKAACQELEELKVLAMLAPDPSTNIPGLIKGIRNVAKIETMIDATLQRQQRLRELKSKVQMQHEEGLDWAVLKDADFESKLKEELRALRKYHNDWLEKLSIWDVGALVIPHLQERELARKYRDRYGRTFAWLHDRGRCADYGGCCGRSCNCCEKPVRTYLRHNDEGEREVFEVRAHCTGECVCCIRFYGFYEPVEGLPATGFKDCRC